MKEWPRFRDSEHKQLTSYEAQGMFGEPCPLPKDGIVLPWVWNYLFKIDPVTFEPTPKARGTCDGSTRQGKIVTLAETYAACVEQPIHRLTWAILASMNYVGVGFDVTRPPSDLNRLRQRGACQLLERERL